MVTPKDIDFLIDKLSLLIANTINKTLHDQFNPTKQLYIVLYIISGELYEKEIAVAINNYIYRNIAWV